MVPIDLITYALWRRLAKGAVSGVKSMRVEEQKLIILTNNGEELTMTFPTPKDGVSIADIRIDENNHLICTLSDGNIIDAGALPTSSTSTTLPIASKTRLGGIKVGKNLSIEEDGTLNAAGGGSGTGTSDYDELVNKPTLNGIEISGEKTAADYGIKEDKTYIFTQETPTTEWVIKHNMGKYPAIIIVDDNKYQVWAEIQFVDLNTVKAIFTTEFTGQAFLN